MTVDTFLSTAPHEGDLHLIFDDGGLKPYYAMDRIRKDHDGWKTEGKPTATIDFDGKTWALCYDYDTDNPLDPWESESYTLQTVPEFRFYLVAKDDLYDGERADQSSRIRGGTITVRPRWPGMTHNGGTPVRGIPNLGGPYIDVQIQVSNIDHTRYDELVREVFSAFGLPQRYFSDPHQTSNWNDIARYVRIHRDHSGPIYGAKGPIARLHQVIESDRSGYRQHTEDHRKLPGYMVKTMVSDDRAREIVAGHTLGKEVKHYYPRDPSFYEPGDALYHPKLEVSYQSSKTDETVYWSDTEDALREIEETILNVLDWSELPIAGGKPYISDDYFSANDGRKRSRKIVACPLPEIEDAQENAVMKIWGDMTASDTAVIDHLLTDGGSTSMTKAADATGYSYRTIRAVVDRCSEVIRHSYGELELASKHQRDMLLSRIRAAEDNFKNTIEDAAMTAAETASDLSRSKWSEVRQRYNATVDHDPSDCRKKISVGYVAEDRQEARNIVQELRTAYLQTHDDRGGSAGVTAVVTLEDRSVREYKSLETRTKAPTRGSDRTRSFREKVESVDWEAHGIPDLTTS